MSDQQVQTRPAVRRRGRMLPEDVLQWKAMSLQALGWGSKTAEQTATFDAMQTQADTTRERGMRGQGPHGATATQGLLKGSGDAYKDYHKQLTSFEAAQDRTPKMVSDLKGAAQAYIDHFAKHDGKRQADPKNIAKKEACEATIRELAKFGLADEVDRLGPPPWDGAKALQGAALRTEMDMATLPPGKARAENLGGTHLSPAFWINRKNGAEAEKTFIFKPAATSEAPGFPSGGEPSREAMGGRMAGMLNGALGMSIPVPDTNMVSLGKESLDQATLEKLVDNGKLAASDSYVGSVQQFEQTGGEMRRLGKGDLAKIPAKAAQELAVFDTIMLNTDRHAGNFLVKTGTDGVPQLVPIDQGLCLPTRGSNLQITGNIGTTHNAMLSIPASHQAFDPAVLKSLAKLDPEALAEAMKRERATLEAAHPSTAGKISDESIDLAKRSAMFLKRAAPKLTPAAVQIGIARFQDRLFDPALDANGFDAAADEIIALMETELDDIKEYCLLPPELQRKLSKDLAAKGWDVGRFSTGDSILTSPAQAMKAWRAGAAKPKTARDPGRRPLDWDETTERELQEALKAFPKLKPPTEIDDKRSVVEDWRDWQALNGPARLREACDAVGVRGDNIAEAVETLSKAVPILKQAESLAASLAVDGADPRMGRIRRDVEYIEGLIPVLAPSERGKVATQISNASAVLQGRLPPTEQFRAQAGRTLPRLRDQVADTARARLLTKFDGLIPTVTDAGTKKTLVEARAETESFAIADGYAALKKANPALADTE